jgi:uncharacterized protein YjiS (DUF1127 family)
MSATRRALDGVESIVGSGFRGIARLIGGVAERVRVRLEARRWRRRLRCLDDHLLRDIGIRRAALGRDSGDLRGIADALTPLIDRRGHR